jgi:hypothetical protein
MQITWESMNQRSPKLTDDPVVSWKVTQIALRTAHLSSFPEKHRLQKVSGNLNTQFLLTYKTKEYIPLYYLLLTTRVAKIHRFSEAFKQNTIKIQTFQGAWNKRGCCIILCTVSLLPKLCTFLVVKWIKLHVGPYKMV